jgi:hypothetical protein
VGMWACERGRELTHGAVVCARGWVGVGRGQIGSMWSEAELAPIDTLINDRLSRLLTVREKDDGNLLLMCDILFRFLSVDLGPCCPLPPTHASYIHRVVWAKG